MFGMHKARVRSFEKGLHFADGEFKGLLGEGRHRFFSPLRKVRVDVVNQRTPWLYHEDLDVIVTNAGATLTGNDAWTSVVRTSPKAHPPDRPVLITRSYGFGRVCAIGDTNAWIPGEVERPMDVPFTKAVFDWLLFER